MTPLRLVPNAWAEAIERCGQVMRRLDDEHGLRLTMLNLGGGFPARYDAAAKVPPLEDYGLVISDALDQHLPYSVQRLVIEPGRGLVAEAGTLVANVIAVAEAAPRGDNGG